MFDIGFSCIVMLALNPYSVLHDLCFGHSHTHHSATPSSASALTLHSAFGPSSSSAPLMPLTPSSAIKQHHHQQQQHFAITTPTRSSSSSSAASLHNSAANGNAGLGSRSSSTASLAVALHASFSASVVKPHQNQQPLSSAKKTRQQMSASHSSQRFAIAVDQENFGAQY